MHPFAGGFHKTLELYKLIGKMHSNTVLNALLHAVGRLTRKRKQWIEYPSDPDDAATLLRLLAYAIRVCICEELVKEFAAKGIQRHPTPSELEGYFLDLASGCPAAMCVLHLLRDLEVVHMVEDTEKYADRDRAFAEFVETLPLQLRIHVANNAVNYAAMTAHEILSWKKQSPGMKRFFAHFSFTRRTQNNLPMFADRATEKMVGEVRKFLGKKVQKGMEKKIEAVYFNLNKLIHCGRDFHAEILDLDEGTGKRQARTRSVCVSKEFLDCIQFFRNSGVFVRGAELTIFEPVGGDGHDRDWCQSRVSGKVDRRAMVGMAGELLDPEFFERYNTTVDLRAKAYTDAAVQQGGKCVKFRTDITAIDPTKQGASLNARDAWYKQYSTSAEFIETGLLDGVKKLKRSPTKVEICRELDANKSLECLKGKIWRESLTKPELAKLLSQARTELQQAHAPPDAPQLSAAGDEAPQPDMLASGGFNMSHWQYLNLVPK